MHTVTITNASSQILAIVAGLDQQGKKYALASKATMLLRISKRSLQIASGNESYDFRLSKAQSSQDSPARQKLRFITTKKSRRVHLILVIDALDLSNWMATIPDDRSTASLFLSGTHETIAFYGLISKCQRENYTNYHQLKKGLRFFDLRFSVRSGILKAYHGIQPQLDTATHVFASIYSFLEKHPSETCFCSIKEEGRTNLTFAALVAKLVEQTPQRWFTEDRFPDLGEARGRIILLSRFGDDNDNGIHPKVWPYNLPFPFETPIGRTNFRVQDWCLLPSALSIPEKFAAVKAMLLDPALPTDSKADNLFRLNFTSASTPLGGLPSIIALGLGFSFFGLKGINERLYKLLAESRASQETSAFVSSQGHCFLTDFVDQPQYMVELIISFNFL